VADDLRGEILGGGGGEEPEDGDADEQEWKQRKKGEERDG